MSYVMYPKVFEQYKNDIEQYGDVSKLPTRAFIEPMELGEEIEVELEKGKTLGIKLSAVGQVLQGLLAGGWIPPARLRHARIRQPASMGHASFGTTHFCNILDVFKTCTRGTGLSHHEGLPHNRIPLCPSQLNPKDATREVFFEFNGMPRSVFVQDTTAKMSQVSHASKWRAAAGVCGPHFRPAYQLSHTYSLRKSLAGEAGEGRPG